MLHAEAWLFDAVYAAMHVYCDGFFSVARRVCRNKLRTMLEEKITELIDDSTDM